MLCISIQAGWFSVNTVINGKGYLDSVNDWRCSRCPAGTYSTTVGGIGEGSCTRCPTGWTTSSSGAANSSSACNFPICPTGYANMALGKYTKASANEASYPVALATDDSLSTYNSSSIYNASSIYNSYGVDSWFYLDLGTPAIQVSSVYIWQRTDCERNPASLLCSSRMQNLDVRVGTSGNGQANALCNYQAATWTGVFGINLPCSYPLTGPIVTIQGKCVMILLDKCPLTAFPSDCRALLGLLSIPFYA